MNLSVSRGLYRRAQAELKSGGLKQGGAAERRYRECCSATTGLIILQSFLCSKLIINRQGFQELHGIFVLLLKHGVHAQLFLDHPRAAVPTSRGPHYMG